MSKSFSKSLSKDLKHLYEESIARNHCMLSEHRHINPVKQFLYETCPKKTIYFTKQLLPQYSVHNLGKTLSNCCNEALQAVPPFRHQQDLIDHRRLYQRDLREYCADNNTILLPNGPVQTSNQQFDQLYEKLILESNELLWSCSECRFMLEMMKPAYGQESSLFNNNVLNELIAQISNILVDIELQNELSLLSVYETRCEQLERVVLMPQLQDTRFHFQMEQNEQLFIMLESWATRLRNHYGCLYQFAHKNRQSILEAFKSASHYTDHYHS